MAPSDAPAPPGADAPAPVGPPAPLAPPLLALGSTLLSVALGISGGHYHPLALGLATLAALAALAAPAPGPAARPGTVARTARTILVAGLIAALASHLFHAPGLTLQPRHPAAFRALAAIATALAASFAVPGLRPSLARWRFPLLLCCFAGMGAVVLRASPRPTIDVWFFQQAGALALRDGVNPYRLVLPNIYGHEGFYGPGFLEGGRVVVYPYPPFTALFDLPAFLAAGDVRWGMLAAALLAAAGIRKLGEGPTAELAALLLLFQSRTFLVLEMAWTEPTVLAAFAWTLLLASRWTARAPAGWFPAALAAGLLLASKQYAPLLLLPLTLAVPRRGLVRGALVAVGLAAAIALPFVAWDPREFWRDVVVAQLLQPFRMDSLSWLVAWARATGRQPSAAIGFALAAVALVPVLRRRPSLPGAAAAAASSFLLLLLFNKQAFCNYYWLAVGLLAAACAAAAPREG